MIGTRSYTSYMYCVQLYPLRCIVVNVAATKTANFVTDRKSKASSPTIGREALVDRALELADADGIDAVTIRRLAQDFSVTPMALYWHVKNKDELLAAMGDRIFSTLDVSSVPADLPWLDQITGLLTALVGALRRHPGSVELAAHQILQNDRGCELSERFLELLRQAGFTVTARSSLAHAALRTAMSLVMTEPGAELSAPSDERDSIVAHKRATLRGLSSERFPNLIECADDLVDCDDENEYYVRGINLYVAGVRGLAAAF